MAYLIIRPFKNHIEIVNNDLKYNGAVYSVYDISVSNRANGRGLTYYEIYVHNGGNKRFLCMFNVFEYKENKLFREWVKANNL